MLDFQAARWLMAGEIAPQAGNDHPTGIPTGLFPTSDGHVNIAASSTRMWDRLCDALEQPDWKAKPEWRTQQGRSRDRAAVNATIAEVTRTRPSAYWVSLLEDAGIPCGPLYSVDQVFADPQVQHLGMARVMHNGQSPNGDGTQVVASALNFSGLSRDIRTPTPEAGADTDDVLRSVGYSDAEIAELREKRIV
jgi:crotonobetainyl-CoA:carnitine CoA-transferase CaiB-like acyl-CoA transferase